MQLRYRVSRQYRLRLLGLLAGLALVLAACGRGERASSPAPATDTSAAATLTQTNEGGGVTVKATWEGQQAGPRFTIALDTHSVELDGYDLGQLALLKTDQGLELSPTAWDAPKGGHHREGRLTFPATTPDGKPVIGPETRSLELLIREVGGVPTRRLTWTW